MVFLKRKMVAIGFAVLMMVLPALPAAADEPAPATVTVSSAVEMDETYYAQLKDKDGEPLSDPQLTILKYQYAGAAYTQSSKPIQGVEFKYAKVGGLYQVGLGDKKTATMYGITQAMAEALHLEKKADYTYQDAAGKTTYFYKDGSDIQDAAQTQTKDTLKDFLVTVSGTTESNNTANGVKNAETDQNGTIQADLDEKNPWGLYLVVEYNVSNAKVQGQPISIVASQAPFIVALPALVEENGTSSWEQDVVANVKNVVDTAQAEKKIVVGENEAQKDGSETVADTDLTFIGDTVHFRLKGTVLDIPESSSKKIENYVLTDVISKGLDPVTEKGAVKITPEFVRVTGYDPQQSITLEAGDYTVSGLTEYNDAVAATLEKNGLDRDFTDGRYFTITFTETGLDKLTQLAKDPAGNGEKAVYFYYSATVNADAVIGPKGENAVSEQSGNPNKVKLDYRITDYQEDIVTDWDKVAEFTFGIDVSKQFEDTTPEDVSAVTFKLYKKEAGNTKTYYYFVREADGVYHTPSTKAIENVNTDSLKLDPDSKNISIKGMEEGTYYLEETATVTGYNLLKKPVEIEITVQEKDKGQNTYVADAGSTTSDDYLGTFTLNDHQVGKAEFTVLNTKGFLLPSTGGTGTWVFVIVGVVILAAGGAYFLLSRKKKP